ncbi:MAG: YdcF family protein [Verrucomicrobiaceae bacterium]|nr:MAG: YdcF family protein [Verrucomicrobiaceae bacterium]
MLGALLLLLILLPVGALLWDGLSDELGKADVALVLGNTVNPDGSPSLRLVARLDRTIELYRAGLFPQVIVSGGVGKEGHDEAIVMRDYLVQRGIPTERILVDSQGVNTYASAEMTRSWMVKLGYNKVLVVTQYFHVTRSKLALKKFGIPTVFSAHARYFEMRDLYSIPREIAGFVSYTFRKYEKEQ